MENYLTRQRAERILRNKFHIKSMKDDQWKVINLITNYKKKVLLLAPTGFGKSICYYLPALVTQGLTIVITPTISLMRDQISILSSQGIEAGSINSSSTRKSNYSTLMKARSYDLKVLFIAPEQLQNSGIIRLIKDVKVSYLIIDEAHYISTWNEFRSNYNDISNFMNLLKDTPVLAMTATAPWYVIDDIKSEIGKETVVIKGDLFRSNLQLNVRKLSYETSKFETAFKLVLEHQGVGLIYTRTREETEHYAKYLNKRDIPAVAYNAGIDKEERLKIETEFMSGNRYRIFVSTPAAFGCGINKSDIRFVINTNVPDNLIDYFQNIGRAGRDGKRAALFLLYKDKDIKTARYFAFQDVKNNPNNSKYRMKRFYELKSVIQYLTTTDCRMQFLLNYFSNRQKPQCQICDNCNQ